MFIDDPRAIRYPWNGRTVQINVESPIRFFIRGAGVHEIRTEEHGVTGVQMEGMSPSDSAIVSVRAGPHIKSCIGFNG